MFKIHSLKFSANKHKILKLRHKSGYGRQRVRAWRRRGLHTFATSHITCYFAGTFQRGNAPIAPNPS